MSAWMTRLTLWQESGLGVASKCGMGCGQVCGLQFGSTSRSCHIVGKIKMPRLIPFLAAALAVSLGTSVAAATIQNGSFETNTLGGGPFTFTTLGSGNSSITGWTVTSGTVDYINTYWESSAGNYNIDMSGGANGTIQTTVTGLVVNQLYRVSFDIAANPDGAPEEKFVDALIDGSVAGSFSALRSNSTRFSPMNWSTRAFQFVATAESQLLSFQGRANTAFGAAVDNVSISAVPLPAGGLLLLSALGGIAVLRRRKSA